MSNGIAINSAASQQFLDSIPSVSNWKVRDNIIEFEFDETAELDRLIPPGVYFDPESRDYEKVHAHHCIYCDTIIDLIPLNRNVCEEMADHDYAACGECHTDYCNCALCRGEWSQKI